MNLITFDHLNQQKTIFFENKFIDQILTNQITISTSFLLSLNKQILQSRQFTVFHIKKSDLITIEYNQTNNKEMYSQLNSTSYLDRFGGKSQSKRPQSTYYDSMSTNQKPSMSKSLRWNIEEYKENYGHQKKIPMSSSFSTLDHSKPSTYCNSSNNLRNGWELTVPQAAPEIKKSPSSKSYKCIKFSNEFQNQYEKEKAGNEKSNEYLKNRQNMKTLTMSLGYKSSLTDLMGTSSYNKIQRPYKFQERPKVDDGQLRKMKSSKSQKKIRYQHQEDQSSKATFNKSNYVLECSSKSSKKIFDPRQQEKVTSPFLNKSSKLIRQDFVRPKMDKTTSYNQHLQHQILQKPYAKKHHTYESSKSFHHIDINPHSSKPVQTNHSSKPHRVSIQDFQLGKCTGEGAFGQVFPALHKATKMLVAIKKVAKQKVKYMLEQFINEIKIQMYLDHPNIVKLYGFFDDATHFFIIMEYMQGGSLFSLIKKKKKMTQAQTVEKLKQICIGLKQMHDNSILHRDIKPENIVMTNDVSKLCDFGWAAICKDRRTTYCEGEGYDDSVDIWCIGVLAYEMLCGKTPFYNISRKQTMKKIRDVHYQYPSDLSSLAKDFIDKILKKNPDDRMGIDQVLKGKFLNH